MVTMSSMSTSTPIVVWGETYIRLYGMSLSWLSLIIDVIPIFEAARQKSMDVLGALTASMGVLCPTEAALSGDEFP